MNSTESTTVVGVFEDHSTAQRAVNELKRMGFTDDQIGVISHDRSHGTEDRAGDGDESYVGEGAAAGLATGAGLGALWGLGIIAGVLPAIGPAIAGGTLAAILSSAAAGAAAAGLAGALVGLGMSKEEAEYYEGEFKSGRTLVTVKAGARNHEARSLLRRLGATDISDRGTRPATHATTASTMSHTSSESALRQPAHTTTTAKGEACSTGIAGHSTAGMSAQHTGTLGKNTVQATEEKLRVQKDKVEAGTVNVRKEVHTEHKTIDVPVEREEVVIERRPASGQPASGPMGGKQEINIPVREEEVHIEKTPVVKEEVSIGKRTVRENEKVSADVRKEEIKVDTKGDVNVRDTRR
jgi:uncharacterized protein (TIGR02271 family)